MPARPHPIFVEPTFFFLPRTFQKACKKLAMGWLLVWAGSWDRLAGWLLGWVADSWDGLAPVCVFSLCIRPVRVWVAIFKKKMLGSRPQPISVEQHFIFFSGRGMRKIA